MVFVTVMLTYERTERSVPGPGGSTDDERFGWVIRINGLAGDLDFHGEFPKFALTKDQQFELTSFEDSTMSFNEHDQFHPPMALVTKFLGWFDENRYVNTSSALTAEKNEITYCLWNFQRRPQISF
ncbi:hypothetical protein Ocin01_13764 [Orchesella cincta]|uniref:Uncharacterized protein n=1 Tax=Orchesella cincta TaxID=48709 RepID=A0A1D2MJ30_ORCCI|nr:hypothetical protein Ocin01_13764 [Orchesella cincta]